MKYTLFCVRGRLLRPDHHYLLLGKWLAFSDDYIILQHGILTSDMARRIINEERVPVYMDSRYHTLTIESNYGSSYQKKRTVTDLQQFIGFLHRKQKGLYIGVLFNED